MRIPYVLPLPVIAALLAASVGAQETEIENDVPVSAEATTTVVPGKEADLAPAAGQPTEAKPDRIYTDGALSNPEPKAEDLGLASPGQKMTVDVDGDNPPKPKD